MQIYYAHYSSATHRANYLLAALSVEVEAELLIGPAKAGPHAYRGAFGRGSMAPISEQSKQ